MNADDIGGVVTSSKGPEAGVWVIAETSDFQTKLRKIVVTDDRGRFLLPELPKANYKVWVRGYGLMDSTPVNAAPGKTVALTAVVAPNSARRRADLPAQLLALHAEDPAQGCVSDAAGRRRRQTASNPGELDRLAEIRLPELPPDGRQDDAGNAAESWHVSFHQGGLGTADTVEPGRRRNGHPHERLGHDRGIAMFADWTDRISRAKCRPLPRGRQGWNATWS